QGEADPVDRLHRPALAAVPDPQVLGLDDGTGVVPTLGRPLAPARPHRATSSSAAWRSRALSMTTLRIRRLRRAGLTVSLRPSPMRVSPVTSSTMANPGNSVVHQMPAAASSRARLRS